MVTKQDVAKAYLAQEAAKRGLSSWELGTHSYADSPHPLLARKGLDFASIMFAWECENPAPRNHYWSCWVKSGFPVLLHKGVVTIREQDGTIRIQSFKQDFRDDGVSPEGYCSICSFQREEE